MGLEPMSSVVETDAFSSKLIALFGSPSRSFTYIPGFRIQILVERWGNWWEGRHHCRKSLTGRASRLSTIDTSLAPVFYLQQAL